jgi:hypothetical protein
MPHISVSFRDPDDVIKTVVRKTGDVLILSIASNFIVNMFTTVCRQGTSSRA